MEQESDKKPLTGMSVRELAAELGLSARRVRQLREEGTLSALHDGSFDPVEARAIYSTLTGGLVERERFLDAVEALNAEVEREIGRLASAPASRKAAMAEALGPKVGRLMGRLRACPSLAPEGARRAFERDAV